jgi:hypothetical protein
MFFWFVSWAMERLLDPRLVAVIASWTGPFVRGISRAVEHLVGRRAESCSSSCGRSCKSGRHATGTNAGSRTTQAAVTASCFPGPFLSSFSQCYSRPEPALTHGVCRSSNGASMTWRILQFSQICTSSFRGKPVKSSHDGASFPNSLLHHPGFSLFSLLIFWARLTCMHVINCPAPVRHGFAVFFAGGRGSVCLRRSTE